MRSILPAPCAAAVTLNRLDVVVTPSAEAGRDARDSPGRRRMGRARVGAAGVLGSWAISARLQQRDGESPVAVE